MQGAFAGEAQAVVRRPQFGALAVVEHQVHAFARQQHQLAVAAREGGKRRVLVDLGDGHAPLPVGDAFRMAVDLAGPAAFIAPAFAPVFVRGQVHQAHQAACSEASSRVLRASDSAQEKPTMARPLWASRKASCSPSGSRWR